MVVQFFTEGAKLVLIYHKKKTPPGLQMESYMVLLVNKIDIVCLRFWHPSLGLRQYLNQIDY